MSRLAPRPPELRQTREKLFDFIGQKENRYSFAAVLAAIPAGVSTDELFIEMDIDYDTREVDLVRSHTAPEDVEAQEEVLALHRAAMREWHEENDRLMIGERAKKLSVDGVARMVRLLDELESNNA